MKQPATDQFERIERFAFPAAISAIFEAEAKPARSRVVEDACLIEGGLADVGGQVAQGKAAMARWPAIAHPGFAPDGGIDRLVDRRMALGEGGGKGLADAGGEGFDWEEEVFVGRKEEPAAIGAEGDGRDEEMDVGMMEHPAGPGLEDGDEAGLSAEELGIGAEIANGSRALAQEQIVELAGVLEAMRTERFRDGDGDQVVGHGQEASLLRCRPVRSIAGPALGTVAVIAAMELVASAQASGAMIDMPAKGVCPAGEHGLDRPVLIGGDGSLPDLREVTRPVLAEQSREVH